MELKTTKYWIFVSIGIIINLIIFSFLSKSLSNYVYEEIVSNQNINGV
jgi:hypothetical protein